MKNRSFFVVGALLLASLFTTSCKEIMSNLDEPVKSYVQVDDSDVILAPGEKVQREAKSISTETMEYASSNTDVAIVDQNGWITALATGEAVITASVKANEYYQAESKQIIVKVISIALNTDKMKLGVGFERKLTTTIVPEDGFGFELKWSSEDDAIAKVDANGLVTAVAPGTANITADIAGVKAVCEVTVKPAVDLSAITADYEAEDADVLTGTLGGIYKISIADGAAIMLKDVAINGYNDYNSCNWAGITCSGDAIIILKGTNTITGFYEDNPGIFIDKDKTLFIEGDGSLTANSNGYGCGIGGGWYKDSGNIFVNGGTITAIGGYGAAGIGSGLRGICGDIIVVSGTITTTTGGSEAAGLGGGVNGTCGNITIIGGTINATGNSGAAGIGSGKNGTCGDITINGGIITAIGSDYGAGIGCGSSADNKATCGNITITDGEVTARGGQAAAGIGAGCVYGNDYANTCGNITITGGKVNAYCNSMFGAGIGSGLKWNSGFVNTSTCGDITISGGEVVATKGGSGMYDVGPGELASNPGIWTGAVGTVNVTVAIKDLNGNDATIYTPAPAAAPRRAKSGVSKLIAPYDSESKLTPMKK